MSQHNPFPPGGGQPPPAGYPDHASQGPVDPAQGGYAQGPQAGYAQAPQAGYAQAPQAGYAQGPQAGYAQAPQAGYAQAPQAGYAQAPQAGYAQGPQAGYAQAPQAGYAQAPQGAYGAPPAQAPAAGYGQAPQAGYGQVPPAGQGPPGAAAGMPGFGGLSKGALIGIAAGAAGVLLLGVIIVIVAASGGGGALPFDHGNLPSETRAITRWNAARSVSDAMGVPDDEVPEQAYWGEMAGDACGGYDMYSELMGAPLKYGKKYAAKALAQKLEYHQQALKCGKEMAESVGDRPRYWVVFEDGKKTREVMLFPHGPEKLPEPAAHFKTASDPSSMEDTHCLVPWKQEKSDKCDDNARGFARIEKTDVWAKGGMESLKEFGSEYSSDGGNSSSTSERLAALGKDFSGWDRVTVGTADGYSNRIASVLGASISLYGDDEDKALTEAVKDGAKVWAIGRKGDFDKREMKLVIEAKSESGAKAIKSALKDYHSKLKDKIEEAEDKEGKDRDEDQAEEYLDFIEARHAIARRALEKPEIEVDGNDVIFIAVEDPKESELKKIEKYRKWRTKHSELVVQMLASLMKGELPSDSDLEKLGGDEFVELVDKEKKIASGAWPYDPTTFPGMSGFKVPGGGNWVTKAITGDIKLSMFEYKEEREKVEKEFTRLAEAEGWTVKDTGSHGYDVSLGTKEARFAFGQKASVSTLLLINSNF